MQVTSPPPNWRKVWETTLAAATQTYSITGLKGNTDIRYRFQLYMVAGAAVAPNVGFRFNNDNGANYNRSVCYAVAAAAAGYYQTGQTYIDILTHKTAGNGVSHIVGDLFVKSGYRRSAFFQVYAGDATSGAGMGAGEWTNTADEVTSLDFFGDQANCFGAGSRFLLEKWTG